MGEAKSWSASSQGVHFMRILPLLMFVLLPWSSVPVASAFILEVRVFQNEATGKKILLLGDFHHHFSREENLEQMNQVFYNIIKKCEVKKDPLDIFHENYAAYFKTQNYGQDKNVAFNADEYGNHVSTTYPIFNVDEGAKPSPLPDFNPPVHQTNSTWINNDLLRKFRIEGEHFHYVEMASIDPRSSLLHIWRKCLPHSSVCGLLNQGDFQTHLHKEEFVKMMKTDSQLEKQIKIIEGRIKADGETVKNFLLKKGKEKGKEKGSEIKEKDLLTCTNQNLVERGLLDWKTLEEVPSLLETDPFLFSSTLDKIALLSLQRSQAQGHNGLLAAGALHIGVLAEHLKAMGYQQIFHETTTPSFQKQMEKEMAYFKDRFPSFRFWRKKQNPPETEFIYDTAKVQEIIKKASTLICP